MKVGDRLWRPTGARRRPTLATNCRGIGIFNPEKHVHKGNPSRRTTREEISQVGHPPPEGICNPPPIGTQLNCIAAIQVDLMRFWTRLNGGFAPRPSISPDSHGVGGCGLGASIGQGPHARSGVYALASTQTSAPLPPMCSYGRPEAQSGALRYALHEASG